MTRHLSQNALIHTSTRPPATAENDVLRDSGVDGGLIALDTLVTSSLGRPPCPYMYITNTKYHTKMTIYGTAYAYIVRIQRYASISQIALGRVRRDRHAG